MSESENNGRATKVAAFFDVDGTLLVAQSGNLYIRYLYRQGLLSLVDRVRLVWAYLSYRLGFVNFAVVGEFLSRLLKGHSEESLAAQCRDWYATDVRPYFSVAMLACVRQHKERGDVIVLLTGATSYLCDLIAADLGIDHVVCNELELRDG
ncbi:MAG: HAD family hydrolase, partial [Candidatus Binatia bacterium]